MHALHAIALVLVAVGLLLVVVAVVRRVLSGRAGVPLRIGLGALAGSFIIALGLAYAQSEVCSVLGGSWRDKDEGCAHEFGGNGSNDPSNNRGDMWPWTLGAPGGNWFEDRWKEIRGESSGDRAFTLAPCRLVLDGTDGAGGVDGALRDREVWK